MDDKKYNSGLEYKNKMYRPNIFINAEYKDMINAWLKDHGFKSVNEYLIACMVKDGIIPDCKDWFWVLGV